MLKMNLTEKYQGILSRAKLGAALAREGLEAEKIEYWNKVRQREQRMEWLAGTFVVVITGIVLVSAVVAAYQLYFNF